MNWFVKKDNFNFLGLKMSVSFPQNSTHSLRENRGIPSDGYLGRRSVQEFIQSRGGVAPSSPVNGKRSSREPQRGDDLDPSSKRVRTFRLVGNIKELPPEMKIPVFAFAGDPDSIVSRETRALNEEALDGLWVENYELLRSDPTVVGFIDSLKLGKFNLSGRGKFKRLFLEMTRDLEGDLQFIKGVSRYSPECYQTLSQKLQDISLERSWPRFWRSLYGAPGRGLLNAKAEEIRSWLNDPSHAGAISCAIFIDLKNTNLIVIPKELNLFSELISLNLSNNSLRIVTTDNFTGLSKLSLFVFNRRKYLFAGLGEPVINWKMFTLVDIIKRDLRRSFL